MHYLLLIFVYKSKTNNINNNNELLIAYLSTEKTYLPL